MRTMLATILLAATPLSAQDKPVDKNQTDDLATVEVADERGEIRFKDLKAMLEKLEERQAALARDLATMRFALEQAEIRYDPDARAQYLLEQIQMLQRKLERLEKEQKQ